MTPPIRNPQSAIRNLFLVGFMACGKSTVGPVLASQLGVPFIDLDDEIIHAAGRTIGEIIQQDGEPHFRQLETACLQRVIAAGTAVIALGGGAFVQAVNRELLARNGVSIWLDAPFALCWERIQRDGVVRPLALTEAAAQARYEERIPVYQQAQRRIPVHADEAPEKIAAQILTDFS